MEKDLKKFKIKNKMILKKITCKNFIDLSFEELEQIRNLRNKKEIREVMFTNHIITKDEHFAFVDSLKTDDKNLYFSFYIDNKLIGVSSLNHIDKKNKKAFLGIYTDPSLNIPYKGTNIINCIMKIAFRKLKLKNLFLEVLENNIKAINFYKKNGFQICGIMKKSFCKNRKMIDIILMQYSKTYTKNKIC